jgi:hypothetical protein
VTTATARRRCDASAPAPRNPLAPRRRLPRRRSFHVGHPPSGDGSVDEGSGECAGEECRRLEGEQGKSAVVQRFGDGRIADERHQSGSKTVRDGRSDTEEKVRQHRGEDEPVVVTVPATVENSHSGGVPAARTERDVGGADREVTIGYGE